MAVHANYLTFNYTRTLEEVYAIPESQILHIHGCALSDDLIVGHDCYAAPNPEYGGNQWEVEEGVRERIKGAMNSNYKDVQSIIAANADVIFATPGKDLSLCSFVRTGKI